MSWTKTSLKCCRELKPSGFKHAVCAEGSTISHSRERLKFQVHALSHDLQVHVQNQCNGQQQYARRVYIIHYFHRGPTFVDQWAAGALNRDNDTQCCTTFSNAVINHGWILFRPACVRIELHKCMRWENYGTRSLCHITKQVWAARERWWRERAVRVLWRCFYIRL